MRAFLILVLVLVACGGGGKTSPSPISSTPPPPPPADPQPMMADSDAPPPQCTAGGAQGELVKCAINTMDHYSKRMCGCRDKACADRVNEAMTKWGTEMAKSAGAAKDERPDPADAKRSADIMTRYVECMTKLMTDGTPPPDPCGGGDNPCG